MQQLTIAALVALMLFVPVQAREIQKVNVAESIELAGTTLNINGAGIRKKLWVKVYVGALYTATTATSAEAVYAQSGPNRVAMHILYKEISKKKLVAGWNDGFEDNLPEAELSALRERLNQFNALFTTVVKGDTILLDYLPDTGTQVTINGTVQGSVPGKDFNTALLKVWLGKSPADSKLKKAMLAGS